MTKFDKDTKIVFLDMDGVVNCSSRLIPIVREPELHSPYLVGILNGLTEIKDIKVVLSSVWRLGETVDSINKLFKEIGINLECIGLTPSGGYCRGEEIERWIKHNIDHPYYDYHKFVIIDDDSDMLLNQASHFFKTDNNVGITTNIVYRIGRYFSQHD